MDLNQINVNVTDIIPPENFATIDKDGMIGMVYTKEQENEWRAGVETTIQSGVKGVAKPGTPYNAITNPYPTPWVSGNPSLYEKYDVNLPGVYMNFRDLNNEDITVSQSDLNSNDVQIWVENGVAKKTLKPMPQAAVNIRKWESLQTNDFPLNAGSEVIYKNIHWMVAENKTAASNSVPGLGDIWIEIGTSLFENNNLYKGEVIPNLYIGSNGAISGATGWGYARVAVEEVTAYFLSGFSGLSIMLRYEDAANNLISAQGFFATTTRGFTTPANCKFVCFNVKHPDFPNQYLTVRLDKGTSIPTVTSKIKDQYASFFNNFDIPEWTAKTYKKDALVIRVDLTYKAVEDTAATDLPEVSVKWKALGSAVFEKANIITKLIEGFYITGAGDIAADSGWGIMRIPVKPSTNYTFSGMPLLNINARFEKQDNSFISRTGYNATPTTIMTPAECAYIVINAKSTAAPTASVNLRVEEGSVVTTDPLKIKDDKKRYFNTYKSEYDGEIIITLGDSVTAGDPLYGFWTSDLAAATGATVQNFGSSGARANRLVEIVNGTGTGGWAPSVFSQYGNGGKPDFTKASAVVIMIGHNENTNTKGSLTDIRDKVISQYPDTMVGNVARVIETILAQNPYCKIFIATLHVNQGYVVNSIPQWNRSAEITATNIEIANEYSLPVIDIFRESGITKKNNADTTHDGLHLKKLGVEYLGRCMIKGVMSK